MQETAVNERYSIVHILGSGGMVKVYLAHDEVLDRDVALKVLTEQFADDEELVERFKRSADVIFLCLVCSLRFPARLSSAL